MKFFCRSCARFIPKSKVKEHVAQNPFHIVTLQP